MTLDVKILGPGCPKCKMLKRHTQKAVEYLAKEAPDVQVEVEVIQDIDAILQYDVLGTPVLVIDEEVVEVGKVLRTNEVLERLRAAMQGQRDTN